mmetsp:Transcript_56997/g.133685  ORF Transcript_56997/g.133685 Transcript_56997/m.133685 type:complete len:298 (-) Transcript_56997:3160-4053(-)
MDRQVDISHVGPHHRDAGEPGHRRMHRMVRKCCAIGAVVSICLHRAHHIRWIDVFDRQGPALLLEAGEDLVSEPNAHVTFRGHTCPPEERRLGTIRHDDDSIALGGHNVFAVSEHLLQINLHFWQEAQIDISSCHGCIHGQEAASQAKELHQSNAIGIACGLDVRGLNTVASLRASSVEAKAGVYHGQVVVHGAGDGNQCAFVVDRLQSRSQLQGALVRTVTAQDEELLASSRLQHGSHVSMSCIAALAFENGATFVVDVLDHFRRELQPVLFFWEAAKARLHSEDVGDPVSFQPLE